MTNPNAEASEEIYADEVDGSLLLDELANEIKRYVIIPKNAEHIIALWALHTYCFEKFDFTPILLITSPEKMCGKSRVIDYLTHVACKPDKTDNSSAAVMYHTISNDSPTLLVDEFDGLPKEQKLTISNVLKSGFHKSGVTKRMSGKNFDAVKCFRTFCPKALGAIKVTVFDQAVQSRSINIPMQRKNRSLKVQRFRKIDYSILRSKCRRWVKDNLDSISDELCDLPEELSDRQQDIWEPLICLASLVSRSWKDKALMVSVQYGAENSDNETSSGTFLLIWIKNYFETFMKDRVGSKMLCDWLNEDDERGFSFYRDGLGINPSILGSMLKHYGISPRTVRDGKDTFKGYFKDNFEDAFQAYIPPPLPDDVGISRHNVTTPNSIDQNDDIANVTQLGCDGKESVKSPNDYSTCDGVTPNKHVSNGVLDLSEDYFTTFPS